MIEAPVVGHNSGMDDVTTILEAIERGEPNAADRLMPLVYDELRKVAASKLLNEKPGQTLSPTGLVHEAYLRMVGSAGAGQWRTRGHFFAAAAESMRRILVDNARRKKAQKRGGELERQHIELNHIAELDKPIELVALDDALSQLEKSDPSVAQLVKLRFFAGLTNAAAAQSLGISPRTADAWWAYARTWLFEQLEK